MLPVKIFAGLALKKIVRFSVRHYLIPGFTNPDFFWFIRLKQYLTAKKGR
jgi:hypothetical protein